MPWDSAPLREEIFSVERIEQHARRLAAAQPVTSNPGRGDPLPDRLAQNTVVLPASASSDRPSMCLNRCSATVSRIGSRRRPTQKNPLPYQQSAIFHERLGSFHRSRTCPSHRRG
jgi:hypothetical protein